jgi:hypothetical protein
MSDPSISGGVTKVTNHGVIGAARDCPFWRARGNKAPLDAPARLAKVRFSIAARVKLRPDISCRYPLALRRMTPHGALASLRGRRKPPHDGMRRMGRCNLRDGLAAGRRQDRRTLRTHPTRRPVRTFFCRSRTRYLLACNFPGFCGVGSGNRGNGGVVLAPAELATVDPHPVQNHSQAPGDRDDGSTDPAPLSHPQAPRLQP